jgi:hypothetical protein
MPKRVSGGGECGDDLPPEPAHSAEGSVSGSLVSRIAPLAFPSFTAYRSWAIYLKRDRGARAAHTLLRQTTWDYAADSTRFSDPLIGLEKGAHIQPTIEVRDRPLDTVSFEGRLAVLRTISFPAFSSGGLGLDGEFFGVAFPKRGARVEWWCDGPESWESLTGWAAETREWLSGVATKPAQEEPRAPFRPTLP